MRIIKKVRTIYKYQMDGTVKYFTYIGDSDNSNEILAGEVGCKDDTRSYLCLNGLNMVLFQDKLLIIDPSTIIGELYIEGKKAEVPVYEFQSLINSLCSILLSQFSNNVIATSNKNFNSSNTLLKDISFPEKIIRMLLWDNKKKELKFDKKNIVKNIYRYNVYFAYMGCNVGCEIDKLRPALIWKQHTNEENPYDSSYYVFPISSKIPKKSYYYNVEVMINGEKNIIKINDGKRISVKRILKPLINNDTKLTFKIDENTISNVKKAIMKYFSLNNGIE